MAWGSKTCPNCKAQHGRLFKCKKCGTIFCDSCAKGFIGGSCPTCREKDWVKL
jgi:hypothetical protein